MISIARTLLLGFVLTIPTSCSKAEPPLFVKEVDISETNKPLKMKFEELEREERHSTVQLTIMESGTSVAGSLWLWEAAAGLAEVRGAEYFIFLTEERDDEGVRIYKIGFSNSNEMDPSEYFGIPLDPHAEFIQAAMFDGLITGNQR